MINPMSNMPPHLQALLQGSFAQPMGSNPGSLTQLLMQGKLAPKVGAGMAPPQAASAKPSFADGLNKGLGSPITQLGLNLLANSGPSLMPQSFGQSVGQAGLQTMGMQQQQAQQALQQKMMEARLGLIGPQKGLIEAQTDAIKNPAVKPAESFRVLSDEEEKASGLDPSRTYQQSSTSGKIMPIGSGPLATTTVNTGNPQAKLSEKLAEGMATDYVAQRADVRQAQATLGNIHDAKMAVQSGIISGAAAEPRLALAKALNMVGATNEETIANTESYIASTGALVAQVIKQFGSGSGLSDADREFAKNMAAGNIKLDDKSMIRILDINERAQTAIIKNANETRNQLLGFDPTLDKLLGPEFNIPQPKKSIKDMSDAELEEIANGGNR